ncbi:MAG: nickel-dependent lactate racemase [bacterium]
MEGKSDRPHTDGIGLGYGKGEVRLELPHSGGVDVLLPRKTSNNEPVESLLERSLAHPVGSPHLSDLASGKRSVTIAIPDKTRPPIARDILPLLIRRLVSAGFGEGDIRIFISCGIHSLHGEDDIRPLVGDEIFEKFEIYQNDGRRRENFVSLGRTSRGTPVEVNRVVAESDLVVAVGGLAFHYFAGFTGGRKMIIPGAASAAMVENNHRLTLTGTGDMNPDCSSGTLRGNPVHEDMVEAAGFLRSAVYLVNVISDGWGQTAGVISGDLFESHAAGTEVVRDLFECRIDGRCDVAVASAGGHPLDMNVIQAHKTLEHAALSVRDGGVVVGVLACAEGIGSDTFLPWFEYGDSREVMRNLYRNYELNGHTALSFMQKRERVNIILLSELPEDTVRKLGVTPASDIADAMSKAEALAGPGARVYVFPRAWGLLPVVRS